MAASELFPKIGTIGLGPNDTIRLRHNGKTRGLISPVDIFRRRPCWLVSKDRHRVGKLQYFSSLDEFTAGDVFKLLLDAL